MTTNKTKWLYEIMLALEELDVLGADEETRALYWEIKRAINKWVAVLD